MKINIVTPTYEGWILRRIARSFRKHLPNCTVSSRPDVSADVNFYVNYALFRHPTACDIGFFTHREKGEAAARQFDDVAAQVDWCVAMCSKTASHLPKEKTTVIPVAPDPQFHRRRIVLGVVAREYDTGRKRIGWLGELKKVPGVSIRFTNGKIPWRWMPWFYRHIDYLLILSDNEGGPLPLLEALAMGVPVISSDVGFVGDYTTIRYHDLEELKRIIKGLVIPKNAWAIAGARLEAVCSQAIKSKRPRDMNALVAAHRELRAPAFDLIEAIKTRIPDPVKAVLWKAKRALHLYAQYNCMKKMRLQQFRCEGLKYPYFIHRYNSTWMNERAVEIPIIHETIEAYKGKRILEIGNVMSHYGRTSHDIVDKYESGKGVMNCDILEFNPPGKYDLIVSISTFEHIGFDEGSRYGNDQPCTGYERNLLLAMNKVKSLLADKGLFVMSVPLGFNRFLDEQIQGDTLGLSKMVFLKRMTPDNQWQQVSFREVCGISFDQPFNSANGLMIGFYSR
jgi:hypothetical protein